MSRMAKGAVIGLTLLFTAGLAGLVLGPAPIERDPPRDLPWVLPDYRDADTSWEIGHQLGNRAGW
jgi:hypothetical protein